jgi:hypothetical protein
MLSKKCQYALHALICIASRNESPTQVVDICRTKNIPRKFLEVILLELKNGGVPALFDPLLEKTVEKPDTGDSNSFGS